jgi:hypothetical protein
MVLLDQVIQILVGSDFGVGRQQPVGLQLAYGPVRGRVAIECDRFRWLPLIDTPRLSRGHAKTVPAFDELRRVTLHPTQDRRVRE